MPNDTNKSLKKIKIHFVLDPSHNSENESSSSMRECYEECVSNKLLVDWIKEPGDPEQKFSKNHIFVFENFSGDFYNKIISSTSCLVVGPYCLFTCINKSLPIPQVPTLTMAMNELIISFSCLSKEIKADLTNKVKLMGGVVNSSLLETTTHLVVGKANSPKYEKANERGMNIMTPGWINTVFTASQHSGLTSGTDYDFAKYKCPVFFQLAFSVSGYSSKKKEGFKKIIESHGGTYFGSLQYQVTDILICEKNEGDKYSAAREWGLPCVMAHWLTESVEAGYSLPFAKYTTPGASVIKCSTPTKGEMPSKFHNSDISLSMIQENSHPRSLLPPTPSTAAPTTQPLTPTPYNYALAVDSIDLALARRCEAFLDGCNIYLTGFEPNQEEKLRKMIKLGSGVRFTELEESVSHVVMGAFIPSFHKLFSSLSSRPHLVTVDWLKQSMLSKAPAQETPYLCIPAKQPTSGKGLECPSPLSKKGLQMLISPAKPRQSPVKTTKDSPAARKLLQGYLDSQHAYEATSHSEQPADDEPRPLEQNEPFKMPHQPSQQTSQSQSGGTNQSQEYFMGLMFLVLGFTEEETVEIGSAIREANGRVVVNPKTFHGIPDYVIVPFEGFATSVVPTEEIVTDIWLMECKQQSAVVDVQYYHRPASVLNCATPLVGCVITISNYVGFERDFLAKLSQLLGAGYQEEFMKRDNPKADKKASTHLVCPTRSGSKYNAAIKWGYPSVSKQWLLECAKTGSRLGEENHLTGCEEAGNGVIGTNRSNIPNHAASTNGVPNGDLLNETKENRASAAAVGSKPKPLDTNGVDTESECSQQNGKKRKLVLLNNGEEDERNIGSPVKRTARSGLNQSQSRTNQSQSRTNQSLSQKPNTREERKEWEKLMDNIVSDDDSNQMLPPKINKMSANTKVEAWVMNNHLASSQRTPSSQSGNKSSSQCSQPSDLVKTIDELNQQLSRAKTRTSRDSDETNSPPKRATARKYIPAGGQGKEESQPRVGWEDYVETLEKNSKEMNSGDSETRCFVLSNVSDELKLRYSEIVERLGGTLLNTSQCFQLETTHLIMESPLRSEKLLCSLASGKWILTPRYLEESNEKGVFLPEQEYEFGNPFSVNKMPRLDGQLVQYAQAAYRWRLKRGGAFINMRATLYVSEKRVDSLRRLIQAGGGHVLNEKDALKGTHCFWEDTKADMPISLESFAQAGVYVLPPVYLADYLRQDPPPSPELCLIGHYKALYDNAQR
uniref:DNA topoisomerase 2-binding protein 1-A n=2 Tax=Cacopsylla melanoneura TaxID=428564 RepID=A0A8D8VEZ5_9HEMI